MHHKEAYSLLKRGVARFKGEEPYKPKYVKGEKMTVIALDAMGGDHAPREVVHGALIAAKKYDVKILLVGPEDLLENEMAALDSDELPISELAVEIVNASEVVEMGDKNPAGAVKKKKDSSVVVAAKLVAEGRAGGMVSAGSTGASAAAALFTLKRIEGIERPSLAAVVPTATKHIILSDGGANVESTPTQMLQNAYMGVAMSEAVLKVKNPKVGLLNIGEEPGKGNTLVKETYELLDKAPNLNFIGNIEGREVAYSGCDVCVADGFTGNVFLKTAEGYAKLVASLLKEELTRDIRGKIGALLSKENFLRMRKRVDYQEYGGGQLLGVRGVCVIAHGSSQHNAVMHAVRIAKEAVDANIVGLTESKVKTCT